MPLRPQDSPATSSAAKRCTSSPATRCCWCRKRAIDHRGASGNTATRADAGPKRDSAGTSCRTGEHDVAVRQRQLLVRVPAKQFDKDAIETLSAYLANPPHDTLLLLRTERLDSRQRSAAWFKRSNRRGGAGVSRWVRRNCPAQLAQRQANRARHQQKRWVILRTASKAICWPPRQEIESSRYRGSATGDARGVDQRDHRRRALRAFDHRRSARSESASGTPYVWVPPVSRRWRYSIALTVQLGDFNDDVRGLPQSKSMRAAAKRCASAKSRICSCNPRASTNR